MFDNNLAILTRDAINSNPSIGRVLCDRIYPTTVGALKRAIACLENINPSRFAALRFSADGVEVADSTVLTSLDDHSPGISKDLPFFITLSRVLNGVADPVLSPSEPTKVSFAEKPTGWWSAHIARALTCLLA